MAFRISQQALTLWRSATNHLRARGARSLPPKPRTIAQDLFDSRSAVRLSTHERSFVSPLDGRARPASEVKR
jgi:hypothetical protein